MTRARKTLTLTSAETRAVYGDFQRRRPSRFLEEIPREHLQFLMDADAGPAVVQKPPPPRADTNKLQMGTRVRHARFGTGRVMYTSGSGPKMKVRIRFDSGMSRQFMVSHTPLELLEGK
jgi:DNA helicase-2/ATP-dependent DNA helicase PcrA